MIVKGKYTQGALQIGTSSVLSCVLRCVIIIRIPCCLSLTTYEHSFGKIKKKSFCSLFNSITMLNGWWENQGSHRSIKMKSEFTGEIWASWELWGQYNGDICISHCGEGTSRNAHFFYLRYNTVIVKCTLLKYTIDEFVHMYILTQPSVDSGYRMFSATRRLFVN